MTDDVRFANGLKQFLMRMDVGTFRNTGVAGEIITKLILLRGFDRSLLKSRNIGNFGDQQDQQPSDPSYDPRIIEFDYHGKGFITPKFGFTALLKIKWNKYSYLV